MSNFYTSLQVKANMTIISVTRVNSDEYNAVIQSNTGSTMYAHIVTDKNDLLINVDIYRHNQTWDVTKKQYIHSKGARFVLTDRNEDVVYLESNDKKHIIKLTRLDLSDFINKLSGVLSKYDSGFYRSLDTSYINPKYLPDKKHLDLFCTDFAAPSYNITITLHVPGAMVGLHQFYQANEFFDLGGIKYSFEGLQLTDINGRKYKTTNPYVIQNFFDFNR